jgi:hypothetical protein
MAPDNAAGLLEIADRLQALPLRAAAARYVLRHYDRVSITPCYAELRPDLQTALLRARCWAAAAAAAAAAEAATAVAVAQAAAAELEGDGGADDSASGDEENEEEAGGSALEDDESDNDEDEDLEYDDDGGTQNGDSGTFEAAAGQGTIELAAAAGNGSTADPLLRSSPQTPSASTSAAPAHSVSAAAASRPAPPRSISRHTAVSTASRGGSSGGRRTPVASAAPPPAAMSVLASRLGVSDALLLTQQREREAQNRLLHAAAAAALMQQQQLQHGGHGAMSNGHAVFLDSVAPVTPAAPLPSPFQSLFLAAAASPPIWWPGRDGADSGGLLASPALRPAFPRLGAGGLMDGLLSHQPLQRRRGGHRSAGLSSSAGSVRRPPSSVLQLQRLRQTQQASPHSAAPAPLRAGAAAAAVSSHVAPSHRLPAPEPTYGDDGGMEEEVDTGYSHLRVDSLSAAAAAMPPSSLLRSPTLLQQLAQESSSFAPLPASLELLGGQPGPRQRTPQPAGTAPLSIAGTAARPTQELSPSDFAGPGDAASSSF